MGMALVAVILVGPEENDGTGKLLSMEFQIGLGLLQSMPRNTMWRRRFWKKLTGLAGR